MSRHFDLGDHFDVSRGRVPDDLDVVGARIESASIRLPHQRPRAERRLQELLGVERVTASCANRCQLRESGNLDAPAFVVR